MSNEIPQPVDVNRLAHILGKAKKVMSATESGNYKTGNIDSSMLVQNTESYLTENNVPQSHIQQSQVQENSGDPTRPIGNYDRNTVMNSRLPDAIKQAMLDNPIPTPNNPIGHTFNLEDVAHLMEDKPIPPPSTPKTRPVMTESYQNNGDMITVSKSELKNIIKDVLVEYLANDYSKSLTENTIKKTINTLIKEGKISTKKNV